MDNSNVSEYYVVHGKVSLKDTHVVASFTQVLTVLEVVSIPKGAESGPWKPYYRFHQRIEAGTEGWIGGSLVLSSQLAYQKNKRVKTSYFL